MIKFELFLIAAGRNPAVFNGRATANSNKDINEYELAMGANESDFFLNGAFLKVKEHDQNREEKSNK